MFKTFLKFMAVGGLNALVYFSLVYLFTSVIGVYYMVSAVICVVIQTLFTFGLHRIWVWKNKKVAIRSAINIWRFCKYIIVGIAGMVLGLGGLYIITEYMHIWYMIGIVVASFLLLICNFFANYLWTWGENETKEMQWIVSLINRLGLIPLIERMGVQI